MSQCQFIIVFLLITWCYCAVDKVQWNLDILQHLQSALLTVIKELSSQDFNLLRDYQMYERMGILCGVLDESIRTALTAGHQKLCESLTKNGKASSTWLVIDSARRFNLKAVCSKAEETAMQKYLADMEASILSNIGTADDVIFTMLSSPWYDTMVSAYSKHTMVQLHGNRFFFCFVLNTRV